MRRGLIIGFVLLGLCTGLVCFVLFSSAGLKMVVKTATGITGEMMTIRESGGTLFGGWWLLDLRIQAPGTDMSFSRVAVSWQPEKLGQGQLHVTSISIEGFEIIIPEDSRPETDNQSSIELPTFIFPLTLIVNQLSINNGAIKRGTETLFALNRLSLELSGEGEQLVIEKLELDSDTFGFTIDGELNLSGDWPLTCSGSWWLDLENTEQFRGGIDGSGSIANPSFDLSVADPVDIRMKGNIHDLLGNLTWELHGNVNELNPQDFSDELPGLSIEAQLDSSGTRDTYRGRILSRTDTREAGEVITDISFAGTPSGLRIESSDLLINDNEAALRGSVDWHNGISWHGLIETNGFDLASFAPDIPAILSIKAESEGNYRGGNLEYDLKISEITGKIDMLDSDVLGELTFSGNDSRLQIVPSELTVGDGRIKVEGTLDWGDGIRWHGLVETIGFDVASLAPDIPALLSLKAVSEGTYRGGELKYDLELSEIKGTADVLSRDVLGRLAVSGNGSGLRIVSSEFTVGDGRIALGGMLEWDDGIAWQSRLMLDSLAPSLVYEELEGEVSAVVTGEGALAGEHLSATVELAKVSGVLAGYQLTGGGLVTYLDGELEVSNLIIDNGRNRLELDGRINETLDMAMSLDGSELERLVPSLAGTIAARATVTGTRQLPLLNLEVNGEGISYHEYALGHVHANMTINLDEEGTIKGVIEGDELFIKEQRVDHTRIEIDGSRKLHDLFFDLQSDQGQVNLRVNGSLEENGEWSGQISSLRLDHPQYGLWQNKTGSEFLLSIHSAYLENLCLVSTVGGACFDTVWEAPDVWSAKIVQLNLDSSLLAQWSILNLETEGVLSGKVEGGGEGTHLLTLDADFTMDELVIHPGANEYYEKLQFFDTRLSFDLAEGALRSRLYSRFVDDSYVEGSLGVEPFGELIGPYAELSLHGALNVAINELDPLRLLTDGYLQPKGALSADLSLGGTISKPRVTGDLELVDGEIYIPQLNIRPHNITGSIISNNDLLSVELEADSGVGTVQAGGDFSFDSGSWEGTLAITGTGVEVLNQKEFEIITDADLMLKLGPDGGSLNGEITIPKALIQPEEMSGSVSASDDVIIMEEAGEGRGWPFDLAVQLELGDDVVVDGYGLSGNLKGSLDLSYIEGNLPAGHGELYFDDATFSLYERNLEITRGRVMFGGGPLDNPGLDVSARKTIASEKFGQDDIIVGVDIIGSVDDFEMELYSVPTMDEADIIAYLVVGKSLSSSSESESGAVGAALSAIGLTRGNKILGGIGGALAVDDLKLTENESNETSLIVGKQFTDDLYISYDFNLYKNAGFFKIRYDFGRGFSVESKNSIESNGVNLLYSFER